MPTRMRTPDRMVVALLLLLALGGSLAIGASAPNLDQATFAPVAAPLVATADVAAGQHDWPPLTIAYRANGSLAQLEYQHARQWTLTSGGASNLVTTFSGTTVMQWDGQISVERAPLERREEVRSGLPRPSQWVYPGFADDLLTLGYTTSPGSAPGTAQYAKQRTLPCPADAPPGTRRGTRLRPTSCATADSYDEVTTFIFRTDVTPPVPLGGYSEIDGAVSPLFEVLDIDLHRQP